MSSNDEAARFAGLYHDVFHRFARRSPLGAYRPSAESLAVLLHLKRTGPLTVREASLHFSRSQAATSEILGRLETRGLVERLADDRDRRRTLVYLTPTGLGVVEAESQVLSLEELRRSFGRLPAGVRRGLLEGMEALLSPPRGAGTGGSTTRRKGDG